jgi:hypothetical protein
MQSDILLSELKAKPPVLIINAMIPRLPLITVKNPAQCSKVKDPVYYDAVLNRLIPDKRLIPQMPEGMDEVYYWICQNYTHTATLGELKWEVYRLKGK